MQDYGLSGPPQTEFVNRYRIRINKGHLLFTEHQKFWKSIKNPSQKVKKCEIFSRFWKCFEKFRKKFDRKFWSNFWLKSDRFFKDFFRFFRLFQIFQILRWIFYGFSKILMFWKEETLFFKLSSMSIYEICLQVGVQRRNRKTFFSTELSEILSVWDQNRSSAPYIYITKNRIWPTRCRVLTD